VCSPPVVNASRIAAVLLLTLSPGLCELPPLLFSFGLRGTCHLVR
jgi:hypothetical protein